MKLLRLPLAATGVTALLGSVLRNDGERSFSTFADDATERTPSLARAEELSTGFRRVAKQTLPSINSRGMALRVSPLVKVPVSLFPLMASL